jgi:phosphoglycerate dehydrogenase-like enzyme
MQTVVELAGFTCAVVGAGCVAYAVAGLILAVGVALLVAAAGLVLAGNV